MKNMRASIRTIAGIGALALVVFGLVQPVDQEVLWLICLWAAAPLLGIVVWLSQPKLPRGLGRNVYALGILIALGFVLVSLQLLRQQVVQASAIYQRIEIDAESGQITSNVRPVLKAQRVVRGGIFDRSGAPLVGSEVVEGGFVRRTYPVASELGLDPAAFSNIVGFFSNRFGWSGLEATYNDYLSGERGRTWARFQNDLLGRPQVGSDLQLTIDAQLQARATALLNGRYGSVVVLDPQTGAVLAMASFPGFDPRGLSFNYAAEDWEAENARVARYWEQLQSEGAGQPLLNRPTQGQYPPGSTFKTVTAVAALEYPDVARPDDIRCFNELQVESGAPPVVNAVSDLMSLTGDPSNLERVYAYSCNVAFAQYALRLNEGDDNLLAEVAARFDMFAPPNTPEIYRGFTDLATLPSRLYVEPDFLERPAAQADTGYGQGQLLVTPLQMALVTAAVANDGVMPEPYLVERVTRPDGGVAYEHRPRSIRRTMSPDTAAAMRDNMRAVGEYGFGRVVNSIVPGIVVGGKSGTGEHVPGEPPHAWFIAAAPIDEPRYVVSVMVERGGEGSSVGGTLAGQVLAAAFALETE
jgi:peptidoglycan glycosyltransferase